MSSDQTITLAEAAEINPRINLGGLRGDTPVSFIPMSDVTESGKWGIRQERPLDEVRVGYTPFAEGDVLFAKITPCMENGKGAHATGLTNGLGFGSTEFHVLRARPGTDPRFLYHWAQAEPARKRAIAFMGGSAGQQRVQADFFSHFSIPRLEESDQRRRSAILDTIDEAVEQTEAVIGKLKQVRAGLLHDLLTRGTDENGEVRDPLESPQAFTKSQLGFIPRAWAVARLEEVASVDRGKFTHRPRNDPGFYGGDHPFIQTGDVSAAEGELVTQASQCLNERGVSVSKQFPTGTIAV